MFEMPDFESAIPDTPIQLRSICKETFGHFWKDEAATCSGEFSMAGVLVTGLVFLTGWVSV